MNAVPAKKSAMCFLSMRCIKVSCLMIKIVLRSSEILRQRVLRVFSECVALSFPLLVINIVLGRSDVMLLDWD